MFVGNISRNVNERDLEDEFDKIGSCTVRCKVRFNRKLTILGFREHTLSLSTPQRRMLKRQSDSCMTKTWVDRNYQSLTQRRTPSTLDPETTGHQEETALLLQEIRSAITATSPVTSPESAVRDVGLDLTSKITNLA